MLVSASFCSFSFGPRALSGSSPGRSGDLPHWKPMAGRGRSSGDSRSWLVPARIGGGAWAGTYLLRPEGGPGPAASTSSAAAWASRDFLLFAADFHHQLEVAVEAASQMAVVASEVVEKFRPAEHGFAQQLQVAFTALPDAVDAEVVLIDAGALDRGADDGAFDAGEALDSPTWCRRFGGRFAFRRSFWGGRCSRRC